MNCLCLTWFSRQATSFLKWLYMLFNFIAANCTLFPVSLCAIHKSNEWRKEEGRLWDKEWHGKSEENIRGARTEMSTINVAAHVFGSDFRGNRFFLEAHALPSGFPITHNPLWPNQLHLENDVISWPDKYKTLLREADPYTPSVHLQKHIANTQTQTHKSYTHSEAFRHQSQNLHPASCASVYNRRVILLNYHYVSQYFT